MPLPTNNAPCTVPDPRGRPCGLTVVHGHATAPAARVDA